MALRLSEDKMSSRERFTALKERLGDAFEVIEPATSPLLLHIPHGKPEHAKVSGKVGNTKPS
jgi:hypothetical protein